MDLENISANTNNIEIKIDNNIVYEDFNISNEITKETVRNVIVRQSDDIEYPMICINCAVHNQINQFALDGLKCILDSCKNDNENDSIPVYLNTKDSLLEIGRASYNKLYRYLDNFVKTCINDKVRVYKFNSQSDKERIDRTDPTKVILNL